MTPSRSSSSGSALQIVVLASFLLFGAACSGGGGSSPTEPVAPAPEVLVLHINWEYDMGQGPIAGDSHPIAGNTVVLFDHPGGYCSGPTLSDIVCWPDVAECRTTESGLIQAYYHDSLSADGPGSLGPLVAAGCSFAEEYGFYVKCCLVDS